MEDRIAQRMNQIYREKIGMFGEGVRKRRKPMRRASSKRGGYGDMDDLMMPYGGMSKRKMALKSHRIRRSKMGAGSKRMMKPKRMSKSKRGGVGTREGALKGWISRFSRMGKKSKGDKEVKRAYRSLSKSKKGGVRAGVTAGRYKKSRRGGVRAGSKKNPWLKFLADFRKGIKQQGLDIPSAEIMKMAGQEYRKM